MRFRLQRVCGWCEYAAVFNYRQRRSRRDARSVGRSRPIDYSPPEAVPARRRVCGASRPINYSPPEAVCGASRPIDYSPPEAVPARRRVCGASRPINYSPPEAVPARRRVCGASRPIDYSPPEAVPARRRVCGLAFGAALGTLPFHMSSGVPRSGVMQSVVQSVLPPRASQRTSQCCQCPLVERCPFPRTWRWEAAVRGCS